MEKVVKVTLETAVGMILDQKSTGKFFSVEAIKRTTGELRHYKGCRGGVSKYVSGKGMSYVPGDKGLIGVWEAGNEEETDQKDKYRNIAVEGIKAVICDKIRFEVLD